MRVLEQDRFEIVSLRMSNAAPVEGGGLSKAMCNATSIGENTQLDFGRTILKTEFTGCGTEPLVLIPALMAIAGLNTAFMHGAAIANAPSCRLDGQRVLVWNGCMSKPLIIHSRSAVVRWTAPSASLAARCPQVWSIAACRRAD